MYEDTVKWLRDVADKKQTVHGGDANEAADRLEKIGLLHERLLKEQDDLKVRLGLSWSLIKEIRKAIGAKYNQSIMDCLDDPSGTDLPIA